MDKNIQTLIQRFYLIYEFYKKNDSNNTFILDEFRKIADQSFQDNNRKALVKLNKEMDKMIRESPPSERAFIEKELSNLDEEIYLDENNRLSEIRSVLKSGTIKNDDEYKLLLNHAEELFREKKDMDEVNRLLVQYTK